MTKKRIQRFFEALDRALQTFADIIVIGASAGTLMGHIRPSIDIDFEIRLKGGKHLDERQEQIIKEVALQSHLAVNYSENISRWSMIDFLDYRKTAVAYSKFGKLNVKLIAPEYWTIGKMARFSDFDISDIMKIVKIKKLSADKLIRVWARAFQSSDVSLEKGDFKKHVVYFLRYNGKRLWGKLFESDEALKKYGFL